MKTRIIYGDLKRGRWKGGKVDATIRHKQKRPYERNKGSIEIIGDFISERILFAEAGVKTALHEYRNGYVDTKYQTCNVDVAERNNRRLLTAVKTAQSQHKKYLAIQKAYYDAIK